MHRPVLRFIPAILVVSIWLGPAPARATVMVEISLPEMVASADAVVRGTVVRIGTVVALVDGVLEPRTHVWISVSESLAGVPVGKVVQLWEPGGRYGDTTLETIGTPAYHAGDEVVVFLRRDEARPGMFRTHQMAQGKYRVLPGAVGARRKVARDLDEIAFASWPAGRFQVRAAAERAATLDDLLAGIRRVRGGARP